MPTYLYEVHFKHNGHLDHCTVRAVSKAAAFRKVSASRENVTLVSVSMIGN